VQRGTRKPWKRDRRPVISDEHGSEESTAGLSAERIARNDAIFRKANAGISAVAGEERDEPMPLICECADPACREIILMPPDEYAAIRTNPRLFFKVPGHEAAAQGWGQVVERHDNYVVAEKVGVAGEVVEQLEGKPNPETAPVEVEALQARKDEA
jgi:hypothetical protein